LRRCLREPIPAIFEAASLLSKAVNAHNADDKHTADRLFKTADMPSIWHWTDSIWGKHSPEIRQLRNVPNAPPLLPLEERVPVRMPSAEEQRALIARDGHRCRFCGIPLVHKRIRVRLSKLYPVSVPWGRTNASQHAAFQAMWLQFDHVLPHARGGDNSLDNILITCAPCNFGRMNNTLEEMSLIDPRTCMVERIDWDGLESLV
jgi:hypothetical protein